MSERLRSVPDCPIAALLAAALFLVDNRNSCEIGSHDSQPTTFAAGELLLRGRLSLNHADLQIAKCWRTRPSPQTFNLSDASAFRTPHR